MREELATRALGRAQRVQSTGRSSAKATQPRGTGPRRATATFTPAAPRGLTDPPQLTEEQAQGNAGLGGVILFFALVYTKTTYRNNKIFHS